MSTICCASSSPTWPPYDTFYKRLIETIPLKNVALALRHGAHQGGDGLQGAGPAARLSALRRTMTAAPCADAGEAPIQAPCAPGGTRTPLSHFPLRSPDHVGGGIAACQVLQLIRRLKDRWRRLALHP